MRALRCIAGGAALIFLTVASSASGQEPARFFDDNCGVCHAVGGPPGAAPDLKDVTRRRSHTWLVHFITNPDEAAKTDPDAAALVKEFDGAMPATEGASTDLIDALLRHIESLSGSPPTATAADAHTDRSVTAADLAAGRDFYAGRRPLTAGAPACVSCHRVGTLGALGGGTLGPDLTLVSRRLGGARSLTNWLSNPPTRVMRAVHRAHPLVDDERFALAALLADQSSQTASPRSSRWTFMVLGLVVALAALTMMAAVWSRRMTAVRRPLVDAARRRLGDDL